MEGTTIPHEIIVHWDGATVLLKPAPEEQVLLQDQKYVLFLNWPVSKMSWQKIWEQAIPLTKSKQLLQAIETIINPRRN